MIRFAVLLLLAFPFALHAQPDPVPAGYTIEGRFDSFTTDEMGNVYALHGDELRLFDAKGRSWLRNSVKTFGQIGNIDAFYSLKPMLFAPEQGQIAVLDNTLSLQGSVINLPREGYLQVTSACMSVQNCFWFFDQRELSVIRVDAQLRKLANSGRLDQQLGFAPQPTSLQEQESRLYVNDPAQGLLVFDLFGTYVRTIPITGIRSFEVRGERLWFLDAKGLKVYDMRSFVTVDVPMEGDLAAVLDVRVDRGRYYVLTAERIIVRPLPLADEER